jgi:hypothetical protein
LHYAWSVELSEPQLGAPSLKDLTPAMVRRI